MDAYNPVPHDLIKDALFFRSYCLEVLKRHRKGVETYGISLLPFSGINGASYAWEEILDAVIYMKLCTIESRGIKYHVFYWIFFALSIVFWWLFGEDIQGTNKR